jgi:hypothetical protein
MVQRMAPQTAEFISIKEAARLARRHPNTIKRWANSGAFVTIKPGGTRNSRLLIDRASFLTHLRSTVVQPNAVPQSKAKMLEELRVVFGPAVQPRALLRIMHCSDQHFHPVFGFSSRR